MAGRLKLFRKRKAKGVQMPYTPQKRGMLWCNTVAANMPHASFAFLASAREC
jgi:hypothetical protein